MVSRLRDLTAPALLAFHMLRRDVARRGRRIVSLSDRLAAIPTQGLPLSDQVTIFWNEHQVPFIEARNDDDLAVALGVVHSHLRLGQMELLRKASRGRLSEAFGSIALDIDQLLRILNFGRSVPAIVSSLPTETRRWLDGFVMGINHYLAHARELPDEFSVLGLKREPWTIDDVVTVGRLASIDVTWLVYFRLLPLCHQPLWPRLWQRLCESEGASPAVTGASASLSGMILRSAVDGACRSGSNAIAVCAGRSATGAPLVAADPHLSILLPNLWLIAGFRSPSCHVVGLMIPGLPFFAMGRNPWIAVAKIDANAKLNTPVFWHIGVPVDHGPLHFKGTPNSFDWASELNQHPVTGRLDDAPAMLFDFRIDQLSSKFLEARKCALLIRAH